MEHSPVPLYIHSHNDLLEYLNVSYPTALCHAVYGKDFFCSSVDGLCVQDTPYTGANGEIFSTVVFGCIEEPVVSVCTDLEQRVGTAGAYLEVHVDDMGRHRCKFFDVVNGSLQKSTPRLADDWPLQRGDWVVFRATLHCADTRVGTSSHERAYYMVATDLRVVDVTGEVIIPAEDTFETQEHQDIIRAAEEPFLARDEDDTSRVPSAESDSYSQQVSGDDDHVTRADAEPSLSCDAGESSWDLAAVGELPLGESDPVSPQGCTQGSEGLAASANALAPEGVAELPAPPGTGSGSTAMETRSAANERSTGEKSVAGRTRAHKRKADDAEANPAHATPPKSKRRSNVARIFPAGSESAHLSDSYNNSTVKAWLLPDGAQIHKHLYVRVPLISGVIRAHDIQDVDCDMWMDAGRGRGEAAEDISGRVFRIDRYPLDEPRDLDHSWSIVVTHQDTRGPNAHPLNFHINSLVPDLAEPWRGNVLIFRHGRTSKKVVVGVEEQYWVAVKWLITTYAIVASPP
ncbi:hypothetical protein B0H15DRAFT_797415 [Mycena belliarum]|uniref:Uncharacterized protein n=1 Tax=Mycena belliarum TaxID=1033014 RepID=A0AAD6UH78_9AGAR|nr:hypothetical protein B0H15DRAFT_797415 [Mycena belliae]